MRNLRFKPLEEKDDLKKVKKLLNFLFIELLVTVNEEDAKNPVEKFVKENPDLFFEPKRKTDL